MRESAAAARCELSLDVSRPVEGRWDRLRIEQVLMNLISNAIKYAAGGPIRVSVAREGQTALVQVSDSGPGIPEPQLRRIFERFERAASARHYGGHGARSLYSAPDRGSPWRLHRRDQSGRRRGLLHRELAGRPIEIRDVR